MNFVTCPDFSSMTQDELLIVANKYYQVCKTEKKKNKLYQTVITQLTDEPVEKFIQLENDEKNCLIHEENITAFKLGGDSRGILTKLKTATETSNNKIKELEDTSSFLQRQLKSQEETSCRTIKDLQSQLTLIKDLDPIERKRELFTQLFSKRKTLPIKDIQATSDTQSYLLSQLFSSEYLSSTKDGKDQLFQEQKEVELNIIESCISLLRNHFESLPTGVIRLDRSYILYDISLILNQLLESRTRLSYIMGEKVFFNFLHEHIREVSEIIDLFNSRSKGQEEIVISLSPYEKGLIFYKDIASESYLQCYDKAIDLQKRLIVSSRTSNKISPFKFIDQFPSSYLFCQLEDVSRVVLITSKMINNIVFVPLKESIAPDHFSFFYLDSIIDDKRSWKLDSHLLFIVRLFMEKYMQSASCIFRQFYKDIFGNNEYINGFEEILETKGIERWKQMKVLFENMKIVSDEYMIGEILRKTIRTLAPLYPNEIIDILQKDKDAGDASSEFKRIRERWKHGLPAREEEPEEYLFDCFDKYRTWDPKSTRGNYYKRWSDFLKQEKYCL